MPVSTIQTDSPLHRTPHIVLILKFKDTEIGELSFSGARKLLQTQLMVVFMNIIVKWLFVKCANNKTCAQ